MMRGFRKAVEQPIAKARAEGKLTGLVEGGKPLPDRAIETGQDASLSAAMRLMQVRCPKSFLFGSS
ncbi:MAG: hypothetical protein ABJD13_17815 [Paracoccaceae bacterium]